MVTATAGGKITGLLALSMEAESALVNGDPVHIVGDYQVDKADGTKPVLGHVSVPNVRRQPGTGAYPVPNVPGDCTVEAKGFYVRTVSSGAAVTAGVLVKLDNTQRYVAWVSGTDGAEKIAGITLMGAGGAAVDIDVLFK